jgi:molybdopterin converting factor small subunit
VTAVRIPPTLRAEVGGSRELEAQGSTVGEVLDDLVGRYPALGAQLIQNGELATFVNVYIGGEDIRTRDGLDTPIREGDHLILLPAMAGGAFPDTPSPRGP